MSTVIITYETVYELLRIEKSRNELQRLDQDFFQKVARYLEEKNLILSSLKEKSTEIEVKKTERQLESFKKILRELYERRERKTLDLALFCSRTEKNSPEIKSMLSEEKDLFEKVLETLNKSKTQFLPKLEGKKTETFKNTILVRFLHSVPKFIGSDEHIYGPYENEDIANLPSDIAQLLVQKNRVEEIKNEI